MPDPTIQVIISAYTKGLEDGMRKAANDTKAASKSMTDNLAQIGLAAQTMERAFRDTLSTVSRIYELGKEGAALNDLEVRFTRISGGTEQAAKNMEAMRRATKDTVADAVLMERGLALLSSGLATTDEELETILKTVPALGKTFKGFSADRSMLSYTMMISNGLQSVKMRADDFGISVVAVEARMKELEAAGLAERDALQQAVNEELINNYERLGLNVKTTTDEMLSLEAQAQNLANTLKQAMIPLSYELAEGLGAILGGLKANKEEVPLLLDVLYKIMAGLQGMLPLAESLALAFIEMGFALTDLQAGKIAEARQHFEKMGDVIAEIPEKMGNEIESAYTQYRDMYLNTSADVAEGAAQMSREVAESTTEAMEKAISEQEKLFDRIADLQIQRAYRIEDEAIQTARRREDMARDLEEQLADIRVNGIRAEQEALEDHAERLIDIEKDYLRQIRDIQRDAAQEEGEAIANRDALALVRARRRKTERLREAKEERDDQKSEADKAYRKQLGDLQQSVRDQEREARRAQRRAEDDLQRHLRRQEEDRQRWFQRELIEIGQNWARKMRQIMAQYAAEEAAQAQHNQRMGAAAAAGGIAGMLGFGGSTSSGGSGGKFPAIPMAAGGAGTVTSPTLFLAGERGPEDYQFVPRGGGRGGMAPGGPISLYQTVNITGTLTAQERASLRQEMHDVTAGAINEFIRG